MRRLFAIERDLIGNLPPLPGVFPDMLAPIVRVGADGVRELAMARWGMPGPPQFGSFPVTNIRNTASPHWHGWLGPSSRCLVPVTSFCEWADTKPGWPWSRGRRAREEAVELVSAIDRSAA